MSESDDEAAELPEDTEIWHVHIQATDRDERELAAYGVEISAGEASATDTTRRLHLTEGGDITGEEDWPYTIYGKGSHQRIVWQERPAALGYFLHGCESNGIPEEPVVADLDSDLGPYYDWQDSLSMRDRRLRLVDLAEFRIERNDWMAEKFLNEGLEFRDTGLSESARNLAADIQQHIHVHPRMCYWTAQQAAILHKDNHRVQYVEGLALPEQAGQCIRHAWIEIDGAVCELTWPWHYPSPETAVYFGTEFDGETVKETRERRDEELGQNGPILASDEEILKTSAAMRGEGDADPP